ncbi:MAG: chalcone isomerase family protein [Planctomycetia bacterium]
MTSKSLRAAMAVGCMALSTTFAASVRADDETVTVRGTGVEFPVAVEQSIDGKLVPMTLTGTAVRKKAIFNVYSIGSYLAKGSTVKSADELPAADVPKMLHIVLAREVTGKDIAVGLQGSIAANYPNGEFKDELNALLTYLGDKTIRKGDSVRMSNVPGVGLECIVGDGAPLLIESPKFSTAFWEIYFGRQNLGAAVKDGLSSRL